ncbi:hypothetical protein [Salinisphaera orenii]|uniref:Uncharacterized protein n=1 Tax=Salinisphaera orenii YIM 95161 TaxID=1051139 RepID=A0A423PRN1_9GAMM|nr:hypothetical protein [Salinisphaera halophila]ROO28265.1 hypothetical protein SAHL_10680 [Salinisphaera halophila YIM 95161]
MPATRDTTCDLIERPAAPRPRRSPLQSLPHGVALMEQLATARIAVDALTGMGCLIRAIQITPDGATIALHRAPPAGVLERHGALDYGRHDATAGEAVRGLCWRGVFVEWPVPASEVPA